MWNRTFRAGVYRNMRSACLLLTCSLAMLAQPAPLGDRLTAAIQEAWQAQSNGQIQALAERREEARALLERVPVDSPQFGGWVQQVAAICQNAGLNAQARSLLQQALLRTAPLGDSSPAKVTILDTLAESWIADGNLLKAVNLLEQEAAAAAVARPVAARSPVATFSMSTGGGIPYRISRFPLGPGNDAIRMYNRLATLYQQLGRPDSVAAVASRIRLLAANDQPALAQFYEQHEQLEEAAGVYKKMAENSADPQGTSTAWESLANLEARRQRYSDAIDAMQKAIAAAPRSGAPEIQNHILWLRINLAGFMENAGLLDQADRAYAELSQEYRSTPDAAWIVSAQAQYLANTKRETQGAALLQQYLAAGPNTPTEENTRIYLQLADLARKSGNSKAADQYQQMGQSRQPQPRSDLPSAPQNLIGDELQNAQQEASLHHVDDAFRLALHAADHAAQASDGQQAEWRIQQIAHNLAGNKEAAKADVLFHHFVSSAQASAAVRPSMLIAATRAFAQFLLSQPGRAADAPAAIESFRRALAEANGPDSATLLEPLRMKLQLAENEHQWSAAESAGRDLLDAQASMSGNTSEPYLHDLQAVALMYTIHRDFTRALPLRRQAVIISDLVSGSNHPPDWPRSRTRMDAAMTLANLGQFDEAESLGEEALALEAAARTPPSYLVQELEQIRQMKRAASARAVANR